MRKVSRKLLVVWIVCLLPWMGLAQSKQSAKPVLKSVETKAEDALKQAAALFEAGQNEHQQGNLEKAIEHYSAALKLDPSLWQIELQLSLANLALHRLAPARVAIDKVIEQLAEYADSPELKQATARAQLVLGEIALAESKRAEAEQAFRKALKSNPQTARAHAGLAELMLADKRFAEAAIEAKAALEAGDQRTATVALLGEALIALRQYDDALIVLNELLKREPQFAPALRYRAEIFAQRDELDNARRDLQAAIAVEPRVQDRLRLADWQARAKRYNEASALYQQILKDEPDNKDAQTALAVLLVETGKSGEAQAQLEALTQTQPDRADVRAQLAELYLATQPEKALEQYTAAAKLEPVNLAHQIGVGAALVKLRRFQEAVPVLRRVLAANPKPELAYFAHTNLATALFELDDFANAAREFVWLLNQQREQKRAAITIYFLGICFDRLGDLEQAQKAYQQFLSLASPDNQLEIDKVKLRLPSLQRQLEKGQGKRKPQ